MLKNKRAWTYEPPKKNIPYTYRPTDVITVKYCYRRVKTEFEIKS